MRAILILTIGAATGAAAVLLYLSASGREPARPELDAPRVTSRSLPTTPPVPQAQEPNPAAGFSAERLAIYELAAQTRDPRELGAMIRTIAAEPQTRRRDMRLEALLARLAEIDAPGAAARLAESLSLDVDLLVPLYQAWARADADAALIALSGIRSPARQRELALGLLAVFGNDATGFARVAAALPVSAESSFRADAILARADDDPAGALAAALALDDSRLRNLALGRLASMVTQSDPLTALALADGIDDAEARRRFQNGVLSAWAELDSQALLDQVESTAALELIDTGVARMLAESDPERMLALMDRLPADVATMVRRTTLDALAARDPLAALASIDAVPPGRERDTLLSTIAGAYGRSDPDAALAWLDTLVPPSSLARQAVMRGIAEVDFDRAVDLVLADLEGQRNSPLAGLTVGMSLTLSGNENSGRLLDRLLQVDGSRLDVSSIMSTTMSSWMRSDPESALQWLNANIGRVPADAMPNLARAVAQENPETAVQILASLPPEQRNASIPGIAQGIAQRDPEAALRFLEPYRGEPSYAEGLNGMLTRWALDDPQAAARAVSEADASVQSQLTGSLTIASQLARSDVEFAAGWVAGLKDERMRQTATGALLYTWGGQDPAAARQWVLAQPPGAVRDTALNSLLGGSGTLDPQLLDAYSTERARERGAGEAIIGLSRTDPDEARRLLARHISDENTRREIEQAIERNETGALPAVLQ